MNSATIARRRIFKQNIRIALTILLTFLPFIPSLVSASFLDLDGSTIQKDPGGKKYFYHPDILGSTDLITNESGDIVEETTYEPHGEVIEGGQTSEFLYTSKELDDQTGLYYFGARYYDPSFMHCIHPDDTITDANMRGETR